MSEFIIKHIGMIGGSIGALIFITIVFTLKYWYDTKYGDVAVWFIFICAVFGVVNIGEEIAKWIIK